MANVMHSYKKYPYYQQQNSELINLQSQFIFDPDISHDEINQIDYLEKKCKRLEKKLEEQLNK